MTVQSYTPVSFNGTAINSGNLASGWDLNNGPLQSGQYQPVEASIVGLGDRDTRAQPAAATWVLHVKLTDGSETNVQAMYAIFNPEAGLCYVRATDGNGTTWRTQCRVLQVQQIPGTDKWFWVTLRVPDPRWQEESVSTDNELNQTASPISITLTNNGTRKSRPTFTIGADASKSINSQVDDYAWSLRGFIVNRSPFPWVNLPVALFDASGAASRLATDSSAAGATVQQTTGSTTITADISAGATSIALTSAAGFNSNGGLGWITDSRGNGFHDQFYYTGKSGNNLTGVVWLAASRNGGSSADSSATVITGGGIAHTTAQVTNIRLSGLMLSGDDCRVWINDVEVERYLAAWNSSSSEVWTNLTMPPAVILTATSAATASVPATGGSIQFVEGVSSLPSKGFIAWGDEVIAYTGKSGKSITGIVRGVWGTTAASHAVTVPVYGNPVKYLVAAGYAKATPGQAPTARRPAIQLDGSSPSSNQTWKWGDENSSTGDPQTIYFDRNNPDRTAQWTPGFDSDGNTVSPLMSISSSSTALTFKDDLPGDGIPPYNFAEIQLPQGIKSGDATAFKSDWTIAADTINSELFVRDQAGTLKLVDEDMGASGPITILSITRSGSTATATTAFPHGLLENQRVTVSGATQTEYNITAQVFPTDQTTFTYTVAGAPATPATGAPVYSLVTTARGLPAALSNQAFGVKLKGRYANMCGIKGNADADSSTTLYVANTINNASDPGLPSVVNGETYLHFTVPRDAPVRRIFLRMCLTNNSNSVNMKARILSGSATAPDVSTTGMVCSVGTWTFPTTASITGIVVLGLPKNALYKAGDYWLALRKSNFPATDVRVMGFSTQGVTRHDAMRQGYPITNNAGQTAGAPWIYVMGQYDASGNAGITADQPIVDPTTNARTATTASFDKTIVSFTTGALTTAQYGHPYVHRVTAFVSGATAGSMYHLTGTLANNTTGDSMTFDQWMKPASSIVIDCDNRTVVYTEDAIDYPRTGAITPTNLADWMPLTAGANSLQYTDASLKSPGQIDVVSTYRSVKV